MTQRLFSLGWAVALFSLTTIFAQAETKLPNILGSHMVLQQGAECPIWGWDEPGTMVTVTFAGQSHNAKAGKEGRWQVNLSAMKANPKGRALTVKGTSTVKLTDVLVGEVWLCSGQSNMEWTVTRSMNAKEEIAAAKHPLIRHIKVPHTLAQTPQSNVATSSNPNSLVSTYSNCSSVRAPLSFVINHLTLKKHIIFRRPCRYGRSSPNKVLYHHLPFFRRS